MNAALAQLLHLGLVVAAVPLIWALLRAAEGGFAHTPSRLLRAEAHSIVRLWRKRPVRSLPASALAIHAPVAGAAVTLALLLIIPSFAPGMILAPLGDLPSVMGLMMLMRVLGAMAAADSGTGRGGVTMARVLRLIGPAAAIALPLTLALALSAGSLAIARIAAVRFDDAMVPGAVRGLALVGMMALVITDLAAAPGETGHAGRMLALIRMTEAARCAVWLNLIQTLFFPFGQVEAEAPLTDWPAAVLGWAGRLAALTGLLAGARMLAGPLPERWLTAVLTLGAGVAMLAGLLALSQVGT